MIHPTSLEHVYKKGSGLFLGNGNIHAEQNVCLFFVNKTKGYKIQPRLRGWVQKTFWTLPPNLIEGLNRSCLNFFHFAWRGQKWAKWNNLFHKYIHIFYQLGMISSACSHSEKATLVVAFDNVLPTLNIGLFFPYRQQRINLKTSTKMFIFTKLFLIITWVWGHI